MPVIRRLLLIAFVVTMVWGGIVRADRPPVAAQSFHTGLIVQTTISGDVNITMPGRFALTFTQTGITTWHDLRRDPSGSRNLIADDTPLVAVRLTNNRLLTAPPVLVRTSSLRALVVYTNAGTTVSYEVWAGGQIAITVNGEQITLSGPYLAANNGTGAALQLVKRMPIQQHWLLYLDAWAVDELPKMVTDPGLAGVVTASSVGLAATNAVTVNPPDGVVRAPRLRISTGRWIRGNG